MAGTRALFIGGATLQFWDSPAGGNQIVDLLDMLNTPITQVTADSLGEFPQVEGPDTVPETWMMWADGAGGAGPRRAVVATDVGDALNATNSALVDQIATVSAQQGLVASSLGVVEYNAAGASWPLRPLDGRLYLWVGPTAPPVGGGYMQDGRDLWANTDPVS
jgi:hypothetical protein